MKGIPFRPELAQAVHSGAKTVTRRLVKPPASIEPQDVIKQVAPSPGVALYFWADEDGDGLDLPDIKPRFKKGEIVYVRENWRTLYKFDRLSPSELPGGYDSPLQFKGESYAEGEGIIWGRWRSSLHLPERLSRTTLRILDVRPERLQEITEEDAIAEGCTVSSSDSKFSVPGPLYRFRELWNSINKAPHDWDSNPFVWRIEFERVTP